VTTALNGQDAAKKLAEQFAEAIINADKNTILVKSESVYQVAEYLKTTEGFEFDFLADLTSADYTEYFEVVYHLMSLKHNHSLTLKTRTYNRENPVVPSVVSIWRTADYQEREVFDLMGITFEGHPNMKRLFLWEGFEGYPLRRDYL
jgi:NADH-quinone oxidoreductase subunit C